MNILFFLLKNAHMCSRNAFKFGTQIYLQLLFTQVKFYQSVNLLDGSWKAEFCVFRLFMLSWNCNIICYYISYWFLVIVLISLENSSGNITKENYPVYPGIFLVHFIPCGPEDVNPFYSNNIFIPRYRIL